MKTLLRSISLTLILAIMCMVLASCSASLPREATLENALKEGGYHLTFEDNFDGDELDTKTWINGYPEPTRNGAYYTEDTVSVKNGNMTITTEYREKGALGKGWYTGWIESSDSTSHIMEKDKNDHLTEDHKGFSQKYGYFEAKCKVPKGVGMWSAFWLMPCNKVNGMTWHHDTIGTATDGVEIDVMESFNYFQPSFNRNTNTHVIHMDSYFENMKSLKSPLTNVGSDIYDEFHTYGVMWTETEYIFYIDGKESWRTNGVYEGKDYGISAVEECLLLTCEVPGRDTEHPGQMYDEATGKYSTHWAGDVMSNDLTKKYEFVVDYVKVYSR